MDWTQKVVQQVTKHSPMILTFAGIGGVFLTAGLAGKATLEAARVIDRLETHSEYHLTKRDVAEASWRFYIPTAISAAATIACIVGTHSIHTRRNAALFSLYSLTDVALREYKDKVIETIGENKERKIRDDIAQDHINANPVTNEIILIGTGDVLCMESITGRYFKSDMETIRRAQNTINSRIIHDMYSSHNEFCDLVGLPTTTLGDQIGWTVDNMMDVVFSGGLTDKGEPCIVIDYRMTPKSDYYNLH